MANICFYHNADIDGHGSGAVVRYALGGNVDLKGINYNKPLPVTPAAGDKVYFVDFSPTDEQVAEMLCNGVLAADIIVIDHHEKVKERLAEFGVGGLIKSSSDEPVKKAGIELCWEYFFPDKPAPIWLAYLSAYDTFDKQRFDWKDLVMPFQWGMRAEPTWPNTDACYMRWLEWFDCSITEVEARIKDTIKAGKIILAYQRQQDKRAMSRAITVTFEGVTFIACSGVTGSQPFITSFNPAKGHQAMMAFNYNGPLNLWDVSMYGHDDNNIDLSEIARRFGGGGHKSACGFKIKNIDWILNPSVVGWDAGPNDIY